MKSKTILTGLFLFTTITMVACSSSKTNNTTSQSKPTEKVVKTNVVDEFIKDNKGLIELKREQYYKNGQSQIFMKEKSKAKKKNEQIYLSAQDLDPKLNKVKVTLGEYDNSTKRLSITIKNNYSEALMGMNTAKETSESKSEPFPTSFTIFGYFLDDTGIKPEYPLLSFSLVEDLPAGEEITVKLLMPYFSNEGYKNKSGVIDYSNPELDKTYILSPSMDLVYEDNDQFLNGKGAMANYDNFFTEVEMRFKDNNYPKEAYISDKEVVEFFNLMKE
ncbi:TPA: hypothetical protein TT574_000281 [Streptococcus equi subsp. zooepidemicus]|nr:hypothetical protein [Streptococcus equi subsp. zooepidemicus]